MAEPDLQAAKPRLDALVENLSPLADPKGVLKSLDADRSFFAMVKARADRLQGECAQAIRRNRLDCATTEIPALMRQVATDLQVTRGNLNAADNAALDKLVTRVEDLQDSIAGFTARVRS